MLVALPVSAVPPVFEASPVSPTPPELELTLLSAVPVLPIAGLPDVAARPPLPVSFELPSVVEFVPLALPSVVPPLVVTDEFAPPPAPASSRVPPSEQAQISSAALAARLRPGPRKFRMVRCSSEAGSSPV